MSRYINADELLEHAMRDRLDSRDLIAHMIDTAPSIDIVRCKECKHREEYPCKVYHDDDWYCADGERREP